MDEAVLNEPMKNFVPKKKDAFRLPEALCGAGLQRCFGGDFELMGSLQELSIRLSTLAVFRELQEDAVINSLRKYLAEPSPALYASFVSALYRANGGILGAYVREICENSENVYVQAVGKKEEIPAYLREAVLEELKTLQMTAELTPETLRSAMEYRGFLPGFVSEAAGH